MYVVSNMQTIAVFIRSINHFVLYQLDRVCGKVNDPLKFNSFFEI